MKRFTFTLPGYFEKEQCEKIKEKLQGKTFLQFDVHYGGTANNNLITIHSVCAESNEELKDMVICFMANEL